MFSGSLHSSIIYYGNASAQWLSIADTVRPGYDGWGKLGDTNAYWNLGYINTLNVKTQLISYQVFNRQTASYTLALADASKVVEMNLGSANNLTVPTNASVAFPTGTQITVVQYGAGQTTLVAASGVTLRSSNGWLKLNGQYAGATLVKVATDEWYLLGNLSA